MGKNSQLALQRISTNYLKENSRLEERKSVYNVLYEAIKNCITAMELPHGWLLPSTRELAEHLKLSRTTILRAYELLLLEKLIISRPGSGYSTNYLPEQEFIDKPTTPAAQTFIYPKISEKGASYYQNISLINRDKTDEIAFRPGLPPLDAFPINRWKNLINMYWRHVKTSGLGYSQSSGLKELKKAICSYLNVSRNIKCHPDQIVIVSGSLQSLYLIANTLINPGDDVVVENPLFPNVHSVFKSSRAAITPIALDHEGINITHLEVKAEFQPKLIHVTPSNHYPLGIKMSLNRRKDLLEYANKTGALIIENDYEHEIANLGDSTTTIYSLDSQDRTIYMGTFNRLLHPSIRLGYMIVPRYLKPVVEALQEHSHRFVPPSMQVVMQQFIEKNYLYQHINQCIEIAQERYQLFKEEFARHVKYMTLEEKPFSSFHIIAKFNSEITQKEELAFLDKLQNHGIKALSLSKCYIGDHYNTGLILGYSAARPSIIRQKIQIMGGLSVR